MMKPAKAVSAKPADTPPHAVRHSAGTAPSSHGKLPEAAKKTSAQGTAYAPLDTKKRGK
jgi:hypothetical protein